MSIISYIYYLTRLGYYYFMLTMLYSIVFNVLILGYYVCFYRLFRWLQLHLWYNSLFNSCYICMINLVIIYKIICLLVIFLGLLIESTNSLVMVWVRVKSVILVTRCSEITHKSLVVDLLSCIEGIELYILVVFLFDYSLSIDVINVLLLARYLFIGTLFISYTFSIIHLIGYWLIFFRVSILYIVFPTYLLCFIFHYSLVLIVYTSWIVLHYILCLIFGPHDRF